MAYVTVAGHGRAEVIIKKSRFIANVAPVKSEAEAKAFVDRIRAEHSEATHNCFAYKAGSAAKLSDDGEPSGTAGRPIFDVLEKQGITDAVIVVTRYFGGILLGAGGLVRAYSQAAVAGVEAAGLARGALATDLELLLDYPLVGKVQHLLTQYGALTLSSDFGREVKICCRLPAGQVEALTADLAEASAGRIRVNLLGELHVKGDLSPL